MSSSPMKNTIFALSLSMIAALAVGPAMRSATAREGGGGVVRDGGDLTEIEIINTGARIARYLESAAGRARFPGVDAAKFKQVVDSTIVKVTDEKLVDSHGYERSAINTQYDGKNLIEFSRAAIMGLIKNPESQLVLVFHEYLNLMGVELTAMEDTGPGKPASIYPVSAKIGDVHPDVFGVSLASIQSGDYLRISCTNVMRPLGYKVVITPQGNVTFTSRLYSLIKKLTGKVTLKKYYDAEYQGLSYRNGNEINVFFRKKLDKDEYRWFQLDVMYRGKDRVGMGLIEYADFDFRDLPATTRFKKIKNTIPLRCVFIDSKED